MPDLSSELKIYCTELNEWFQPSQVDTDHYGVDVNLPNNTGVTPIVYNFTLYLRGQQTSLATTVTVQPFEPILTKFLVVFEIRDDIEFATDEDIDALFT